MWTCLAMAVSNVIRGISRRTGHVGPERSSWIADNVCKRSRADLTMPSSRLDWYPTKSKAIVVLVMT